MMMGNKEARFLRIDSSRFDHCGMCVCVCVLVMSLSTVEIIGPGIR